MGNIRNNKKRSLYKHEVYDSISTVTNKANEDHNDYSLFDLACLQRYVATQRNVSTIVADDASITALNTALDSLAIREKDVLISIFYKDMTRVDVAKHYNLSPQRIEQICNGALKKMRTLLQEVAR